MMTQNNHYPLFQKKMEEEGLASSVIEAFRYYYELLLSGEKGKIKEDEISRIVADELIQPNKMDYTAEGQAALDKAVIIKLNGGLGTTMGLGQNMAKSLLPIKNNLSFLEIYFHQIQKYKDAMQIPLILMNSFNTHEKTLDALKGLGKDKDVDFFLQNKYPKIDQQTYAPAHWPQNPSMEWNPPGHGEIYSAFKSSGMLEKCLRMGIKYAFISNSDNLGATLNLNILGYFSIKQVPFVMEVVRRGPSDTKGGHLAQYKKNGQLILREITQCPEQELHLFQDIERYRFFNTNNLWINLEILDEYLKEYSFVRLPMICNPKHLDPTDLTSPGVYQLETAMGNAISVFKNSQAVVVDHRRYIPVKKNEQLLAVWSDCYLYDAENSLYQNPKRMLGPINIQLDPKYFAHFDAFSKRFEKGTPSLVNCEKLKVTGDVWFEAGVVLKGEVVIENFSDQPLVIAANRCIENDCVVKK
jgi:UTP--glucose-1-phosphate uridylyltransferase